MSETDLQRSIMKSLKAIGCVVIRVQSGSSSRGGHWMNAAEAGTPDLVVLNSGGVTTWLEVKLPDGKLSNSQVRWHAQASELGHRVAVVRNVREALGAVT